MLRIGLISDTHGLVRPEALAFLAGCDRIVHAGDVGGPHVLDALARIAPLSVVRGNNDEGAWAANLPETLSLGVGDASLFVLHDLADLDRNAAGAAQVIICGHSHRPRVERSDAGIVVNPGSAGPRRFRLPVSAGELHIHAGGRIEPRLVTLI